MNDTERTIMVDGKDHVISLGEPAWAAFDELCCREGLSADELCAKAAALVGTAALANKITEFLTQYFREMAENDIPPSHHAGEDGCALSPALKAALAAVG